MTSPPASKTKPLTTSTSFSSPSGSATPPEAATRRTFHFIDLFAGVGGFTQGFLAAGRDLPFLFEARLLVDHDATAAATFKKNHPFIPYWNADLNKVTGRELLKTARLAPGKVDVLIGGPPCQGFSMNGKRWLEDGRNQLMARCLEICSTIQPKLAIFENVPPMLSALEEIHDAEIGQALPDYRVRTQVLNAAQFGVPQIRRRAFIVAFRKDLGVEDWDFPAGDYDAIVGHHAQRAAMEPGARSGEGSPRFVSVEEAIGDLPPLSGSQEFNGHRYPAEPRTAYQRARRAGSLFLFNHVGRAHSAKFVRKISVIAPGEGNAHLADEQRFSDNYFSQAYARLHPQGIGFTITAHFRNPGSGRFTHYRDGRAITVREAARLQGFDDRFIFHGYEVDQQRHIGNAVPPLLAAALARHFGGLLAGALP